MTSSRPRSKAAPVPASKPPVSKTAIATTKLPPLLSLVKAAMDDMKAVNVKVLNVIGLTDIADYMVVASGNSDRHVKSIAERVVQQAKAAGKRPFGVEGEQDGEWVLVDLPDIMVHVMLPRVREFYALEELWDNAPPVVAPLPVSRARKPRKQTGAAKPRGRGRFKTAAKPDKAKPRKPRR